MRESLLAFLSASHGVEIVGIAEEPAALPDLIGRRRPCVLVADADLAEGDLLALVQRLRVDLPELNSIVLVSSLRQQRAFLAAGASHALLKGFLDERLRQAVLDLRPERVDGPNGELKHWSAGVFEHLNV